jgi:CheY-like chemotaxis protein
VTTFLALPGAPGSAAAISILLVDDQPFVGMAVGRLLSSEPDLTIQCCHAAADAVATATRLAPSVILQDLLMPDIDGLTLVAAFRRNAATASTPIVVLSGNDDAATRAKAAAAGADDYLVKLPSKRDLVECIRKQVGRSAMRADVRPAAPAAPARRGTVSFDRSVIQELGVGLDDPRALMVDLIDQFLADGTSLVATLNAAAARWDVPALRAAAHTLKGAASTMGALQLSGLCTQLEEHLERQPSEMVKRLLTRALNDEWGRVREACLLERGGPVDAEPAPGTRVGSPNVERGQHSRNRHE